MGFFRGLGVALGSTIFTVFLIFSILMMEIAGFTSFQNVKAISSDILKGQLFSQISQSDMTTMQSMLLYQCSQSSQAALPLGAQQNIILNCNDIRNTDKSKLPDLVVSALIKDAYYKKYDCSFMDCLKNGGSQNFLVILSNEGNQFYRSVQTYFMIASLAGLILLAASLKTWVGRLKTVGFDLVFTGLPFLLVGYVESMSFSLISLPEQVQSTTRPIIDAFFTSMKSKFIIVLVVGAALLIAGFALGIYLSKKADRKK
ncbi:MAG: hypothetical protein HYW23_04440 [Candidatus Aenigmarchaeota archaeon]|nr:hypothetical protein [Candidatus Aenigmarchaeota archaeon]